MFDVNAVSWLYPSAVLEKRRGGSTANGTITSIAMPSGFVEGTEIFALYSLLLDMPASVVPWCA